MRERNRKEGREGKEVSGTTPATLVWWDGRQLGAGEGELQVMIGKGSGGKREENERKGKERMERMEL